MAMTAGATAGQVTSDINVMPMIDVLLVLLIIFMITQPLSRKALDVQIPPPNSTTASTSASNQIVLELRDDGSYAINSQPVPKQQLDAQIHAVFDNRPAKLLFIKAGAQPHLPGRHRSDGRGARGGGADHRLHAEGSEVARRRDPSRARGATGGPRGRRLFFAGHDVSTRDAVPRRPPLTLRVPRSRRRAWALPVSLALHALAVGAAGVERPPRLGPHSGGRADRDRAARRGRRRRWRGRLTRRIFRLPPPRRRRVYRARLRRRRRPPVQEPPVAVPPPPEPVPAPPPDTQPSVAVAPPDSAGASATGGGAGAGTGPGTGGGTGGGVGTGPRTGRRARAGAARAAAAGRPSRGSS